MLHAKSVILTLAALSALTIIISSAMTIDEVKQLEQMTMDKDIQNKKVAIPTDELVNYILEENEGNPEARTANLFNLTAILQGRPPTNDSAMTFIPILTLLLSALG